jgi:5-methylcytosine-specific restriction protein A
MPTTETNLKDPNMARRPCLTCGALAYGGSYCERHQPRNGSTRQWRKTRAAILNAMPNCAACGRPAEHVDHIQPIARGGTNHPGNLQALCASCNLVKGDR